ncbi:MAG: hypothetical protein V3S97_10550 [Candidatus Bathyarchaeia archaeon]
MLTVLVDAHFSANILNVSQPVAVLLSSPMYPMCHFLKKQNNEIAEKANFNKIDIEATET